MLRTTIYLSDGWWSKVISTGPEHTMWLEAAQEEGCRWSWVDALTMSTGRMGVFLIAARLGEYGW